MFETKLISLWSLKASNFALMIFHPFSALIVSCLAAWYVLGRYNGLSSAQLNDITNKSLYPAGMIILVTGAGGVFKQILVDTGAGKVIAEQLQSIGFPIIVFAFVAATIIRVLQGSATVAMITAAGLCAPILTSAGLSQIQLAAIVISIASGATMCSHINDSGFWIVKQYFGLDEKQGIRMWTVGSSILGFVGFCGSVLVYYLIG
jgi:Gnt-I system low-affinity gluconate transporter